MAHFKMVWQPHSIHRDNCFFCHLEVIPEGPTKLEYFRHVRRTRTSCHCFQFFEQLHTLDKDTIATWMFKVDHGLRHPECNEKNKTDVDVKLARWVGNSGALIPLLQYFSHDYPFYPYYTIRIFETMVDNFSEFIDFDAVIFENPTFWEKCLAVAKKGSMPSRVSLAGVLRGLIKRKR